MRDVWDLVGTFEDVAKRKAESAVVLTREPNPFA